MRKKPPLPLLPEPTVTLKEPPRPAVAAPDPIKMYPLSPELAEPELNTRMPLVPDAPAFAVRTLILPLVVARPSPLSTVKCPPE